MLKYVLPALLVLAVLAFAAVLAYLSAGRKRKYARRDLLSPAELNFLRALEQALGGRFRIFPKIRLADIVRVAGNLDRSERQTAFNRIQGKHVDFVLCDPGDLSVRCAVELDDKSHDAPDRIARDGFVDSVLASAGIPIAHFAARRQYAVNDIVQALASCMEAPEGRINEGGPDPEREGTPKCSLCGAPMVLRTAQRGGQAGKSFYGCSTYPKCRHTVQATDIAGSSRSKG